MTEWRRWPELGTTPDLPELADPTGADVLGIGTDGRPRRIPASALGGGGVGPPGPTGAEGIVPWIGAPISGRHYPIVGAGLGLASTTTLGAVNQIDLSPWRCTRTISPAAIGLHVAVGVAAAQMRILIYSADADEWPDDLLWNSGNLDAATTNQYREVTVGVPSFIKGTLYWLGIWCSSTATYRSIALSNALIIGGIGAAGITTTYGTVIRRAVSFASAAPDPWVFSSGEITNNITPPQILARIP